MRGFRETIVVTAALLAPQAAWGATIAFEDHGVLPANTWQLNSMIGFFPNTQSVTASTVSTLGTAEQSWLSQFSQSFRYGLTDKIMLRTTLPLSLLRDGQGGTVNGLADTELFGKALVIGEDDSPFNLSLALQVLFPTALPNVFSVNGSYNLIPSAMIMQNIGPGSLCASLGYAYPTDQQQDGHVVHPSDQIQYGLGYTWDIDSTFNLALDGYGSQILASRSDGAADQTTIGHWLYLCPGVTWNLNESQSFSLSLQAPVLRLGNLASSQPVMAFLIFNQNL